MKAAAAPGRPRFRAGYFLYVLLACLILVFLLFKRDPPVRETNRILVTRAHIEGLRQEHLRQTGALPTAEQEQALIDRYIDDEVLIREARAMAMDRGDPIVRRRLIQKMEFLLEEFHNRGEPAAEELQAYYEKHRLDFQEPLRISLTHIFLDRNGSAGDPKQEAERLFARLAAGADPATLGNAFLLGSRFEKRTQKQLAAAFGTAFAERVKDLPEGVWSGPVPSSYGLHLVLVEEITEAGTEDLSGANPRVRRQVKALRQEEAKRKEILRLRDRYDILFVGTDIEKPADAP